MTRRGKLGGLMLCLGLVCLLGSYFLSKSEPLARFAPRLRRSLGKFWVAKPKPSPRMANLPQVYLWAWERPEDLQFLADKSFGVAFLAKSLSLAPSLSAGLRDWGTAANSSFHIRPRLQPLRVFPGAPLMAVVRIESVRGAFPGAYTDERAASVALSPQDLSLFAGEIANVSKISGVTALQIDFDATLSERALYRALLIEVRKRIPSDMPLSITALASWCIGDRWLEQLPEGTIDEAVPMLFRMGTGTTEVTHYLAAGNEFTVSACTTSLGLSTDEPFSRDILNGQIRVNRANGLAPRLYVFSRHAWNQDDARELHKEIATWHGN